MQNDISKSYWARYVLLDQALRGGGMRSSECPSSSYDVRRSYIHSNYRMESMAFKCLGTLPVYSHSVCYDKLLMDFNKFVSQPCLIHLLVCTDSIVTPLTCSGCSAVAR